MRFKDILETRTVNIHNQASWLVSPLFADMIANTTPVDKIHLSYGDFDLYINEVGDTKYFLIADSKPLCFIELSKDSTYPAKNLWVLRRIERDKNSKTNQMPEALIHYIAIDMNIPVLSDTTLNKDGEYFFKSIADRQQLRTEIFDYVTGNVHHIGNYCLDDGTWLIRPEDDKAHYDILSADGAKRKFRENPQFRFVYIFMKDKFLAESYYWNEQIIKRPSQKDWFIFGDGEDLGI